MIMVRGTDFEKLKLQKATHMKATGRTKLDMDMESSNGAMVTSGWGTGKTGMKTVPVFPKLMENCT